MAPVFLTPSTVKPQTAHESTIRQFTATFQKKEDLVRDNAALKAQLAAAKEQSEGLAQVQKQHEQDVAQLLETIDRRDKQLARVTKLNSDAKVIVQEMVQMATNTARQAQEVAQLMTETAHKAQDLFSTNSDDDDV
jgi:multidrug resistance efflux pump